MPVSLTRTVAFHAWHRYWRPDWTPAENHAAFGALAEPPGHDHHYRCAVTVTGPLDPTMTMVLDLPLLDRILADEVVKPLDGAHIDRDVPEFAPGRALPTCEALAQWLFSRIARRLPAGVALQRVRVAEDDTLHADCTGHD
ncbi:MAG TPA: 6-carboxytetrahydropterin synthase [Gemmatimonadales bacterium]|jgi:6-pyruvoyltetrahydropterin/6-carboxytetrahydropterin synthase|nr:6-carboxytetrahydropterin synthase [Gemmatimonadales bacterium]